MTEHFFSDNDNEDGVMVMMIIAIMMVMTMATVLMVITITTMTAAATRIMIKWTLVPDRNKKTDDTNPSYSKLLKSFYFANASFRFIGDFSMAMRKII